MEGRYPTCDSLARLRESVLDADMWSVGSELGGSEKENCDGGE